MENIAMGGRLKNEVIGGVSSRVLKYWCMLIILLVHHACVVSSSHLNSFEADEAEVIPSTDEVLVRRLGASGLPVSLWPVPQRRSQGAQLKPIYTNSMAAYNLVWLPGGAVKILPRNMQS